MYVSDIRFGTPNKTPHICVNLKYLEYTNHYMEFSSSGSNQEGEKTNYQLFLIESLKKEIEMARRLDPEKLAAEIREIGFSCQHCGKCCKRAFGDNRVVITPLEIERIKEYTGLSKLEVAGPFVPEMSPSCKQEEDDENGTQEFYEVLEENENTSSEISEFLELIKEDIDSEGNIHSFGWILRRKRNGDCIFLDKNTNRCLSYSVRPRLCRTYPFYIEELKLQTCECEGIGYPIDESDNRKLAENLLFRYISELEDTLRMYEKFEDFRREERGLELAKKNLEKGICTYIIHDSTGTNKIVE